MVIVKDFSRLKEFGFEKLSWKNNGRDVWEKVLLDEGDKTGVYLLINPSNVRMRDDDVFRYDEIVFYATADGDDLDAAVRPDVFMELIQAGVAEYIPDNKVKAVA